MPFTLAHPALVLPLKYLPKKWISVTALVIGSVIPDAESYLRMYAEKNLTHSWPGFFIFGLPVGLFLSFVFHNVVRNTLIDNLPGFIFRRLAPFKLFNWNDRFKQHWHIIILCMIVGGGSHFLWDSFSEFDGWLHQQMPVLRGNILIGEHQLEIAYLIQYISTLAGLLVVLVFFLLLPSSNTNRPSPVSLKFWLTVVVVATLILIPRKIKLPVNSMDDTIIAILSAATLSLILACLIFQRTAKKY